MTAAGSLANPQARRPRDVRLDLARGLTMLIIFVAHVPGNPWSDYIPARMGFSSGAETFVLCSGLASGLAFGGVYARQGWAAGNSRIARRVMQLWAIQIVAFAAFATLMLGLDQVLGSSVLEQRYALAGLVATLPDRLIALATLRYVPIFFDILPLYIVLLAATPLVVWLAGRSRRGLVVVMLSLWALAQMGQINLPAHPDTGAGWYFNPLAWQLLFFAGFGMTAGWFAVPARTPLRMALALGIIVISVPLTFWPFHQAFPALGAINHAIYPADAITRLHPLRLVHTLALAWLFATVLDSHRAALARWADTPVGKPLLMIGQQALPTFIAGIVLSALAGIVLDVAGQGAAVAAAVNLAGIALLVLVAHAARALKHAARALKQPAHQQPAQPRDPVAHPDTPRSSHHAPLQN